MLTILAALQDEIKLISSEMEIDKVLRIKPFTISIGKYYGRKMALVRTGVGKEPMRKAIKYSLENLNSSLLINIGYAGGLDPRLAAGDMVIPREIIDGETEKIWKIDSPLVLRMLDIAKKCGLPFSGGRLVTVEKPLIDPHDKAFVGTKFEAVACDMESAIFAEIASEYKVPFVVVRSVLDSMDTALPELPADIVVDGEVQVGSLLGHVKSRPEDIFKLPKFSYLCNQARIAMTNFINMWIQNDKEI